MTALTTDSRVTLRTGLGVRRRLSAWPGAILGTDMLAAVAGLLAVPTEPAAERPALLVAIPLSWVLCLSVVRGYQQQMLRPWTEELWSVVEAGLLLVLGALVIAVWWGLALVPGHFLILFAVTVGLSLVPRGTLRVVRRFRRHAVRQHRILLAGPADEVDRMHAELLRSPHHGLDIQVATAPRLREALAQHRPHAVIAVPCADLDPVTLRQLGWELESTNTQFYVAPGLVDVVRARAAVTTPGAVPLLHVRGSQLSGVRRVAKEVWERTAALLALIVLAPVLAAVLIAIRLGSPGPALFRQTRVGRLGKPFTMLKLRTMYVGAEELGLELAEQNEADGVLFKIREDPRVTRLGKFLRRYSLDEVPQLINVVRGQMALVGPRPALPEEVERYEPHVHRRFAVKPGVTGLWQVSGRSDLSWEDTVRLDLRYVDNWSLGTDLGIVMRTVRAVLRHAGAY